MAVNDPLFALMSMPSTAAGPGPYRRVKPRAAITGVDGVLIMLTTLGTGFRTPNPPEVSSLWTSGVVVVLWNQSVVVGEDHHLRSVAEP